MTDAGLEVNVVRKARISTLRCELLLSLVACNIITVEQNLKCAVLLGKGLEILNNCYNIDFLYYLHKTKNVLFVLQSNVLPLLNQHLDKNTETEK